MLLAIEPKDNYILIPHHLYLNNGRQSNRSAFALTLFRFLHQQQKVSDSEVNFDVTEQFRFE